MNLEELEGKTLYVKVEKKRKGKIGKARELRDVVVVPLGKYQLVVRGYRRKGKVVHFYAPSEVVHHIRKRAKEEGLSFSLYVRRLLFKEELLPVSPGRGKKLRAGVSLSEEDYDRLRKLAGSQSISSYIAGVLTYYYMLENKT